MKNVVYLAPVFVGTVFVCSLSVHPLPLKVAYAIAAACLLSYLIGHLEND